MSFWRFSCNLMIIVVIHLKYSLKFSCNKTKVYSVQSGKTLPLTRICALGSSWQWCTEIMSPMKYCDTWVWVYFDQIHLYLIPKLMGGARWSKRSKRLIWVWQQKFCTCKDRCCLSEWNVDVIHQLPRNWKLSWIYPDINQLS